MARSHSAIWSGSYFGDCARITRISSVLHFLTTAGLVWEVGISVNRGTNWGDARWNPLLAAHANLAGTAFLRRLLQHRTKIYAVAVRASSLGKVN